MLWASHSLARAHNNSPPVSIHVVSKQNNVPHTQTSPSDPSVDQSTGDVPEFHTLSKVLSLFFLF